ncbi:hypothetical protein Mpsy_0862 [Methanolobus psychrophilus R15]|nr:hypothetical protein Mpsy_0862 [Methanolobus psychrophilus R15]
MYHLSYRLQIIGSGVRAYPETILIILVVTNHLEHPIL